MRYTLKIDLLTTLTKDLSLLAFGKLGSKLQNLGLHAPMNWRWLTNELEMNITGEFENESEAQAILKMLLESVPLEWFVNIEIGQI